MKIMQPVLEIRAKNGDLHFKRFAIFQTKYISLYFHRIYRADKDVFLHSHPWNFASIILKGSYIEGGTSTDVFGELQYVDNLKNPGTISRMNRNNFHNIKEIIKGPVWSLFLAYGKKEMWYYLVNEQKMEFTRFREIKNLPEYQYLFK